MKYFALLLLVAPVLVLYFGLRYAVRKDESSGALDAVTEGESQVIESRSEQTPRVSAAGDETSFRRLNHDQLLQALGEVRRTIQPTARRHSVQHLMVYHDLRSYLRSGADRKWMSSARRPSGAAALSDIAKATETDNALNSPVVRSVGTFASDLSAWLEGGATGPAEEKFSGENHAGEWPIGTNISHIVERVKR